MFKQLTNDAVSDERRNGDGSDEAPHTDGGSNPSAETFERQSPDATESEPTGRGAAGPVDQTEPDDTQLDIDLVFDLLGTSRRRAVVRYLDAEPDPVAIGDLADHIAAQEYGKTVEQITPDERKRVYVSLYQCHLPKMTAADVITYEQGEPIERGPHFETFATMLAHADETIRGEPKSGRLSTFLSGFLE